MFATGAEKVIDTMEKMQSALPPGGVMSEKDIKALEKATLDVPNKDGKSIMGLSEPVLKLKNPGIISIPLGFLASIF